jgi:hypothetical protein
MFAGTWSKNYRADCGKVKSIFMSVRILRFNAIHSGSFGFIKMGVLGQ